MSLFVYNVVHKKNQLSLILDLKRLIKYESDPPVTTTEIHIEAGPSSVNIQRLFEAHTITSKSKAKQREKASQPQPPHTATTQEKTRPMRNVPEPKTIPELEKVPQEPKKLIHQGRVKSADSRRPSVTFEKPREQKKIIAVNKKDAEQKPEQSNKENIPIEPIVAPLPKAKMWIRPRSGSASTTRKPVRKTDPVSLYQSYKKDWAKFKTNMCESSHSDLRWSIREKLMSNR